MGSNEFGSLNLGIQATGADAAIQDLKRVEEQGKQTARTMDGIRAGGDARNPANSSWKNAYSQSFAGPDFGPDTKIIDASTEARQRFIRSGREMSAATRDASRSIQDQDTSLKGLKASTLGTVSLIGSFATAISSVIQGIRDWSNASEKLSSELDAINKAQRVNTDLGLSQEQSLIKQANATKEAQLAAERKRKSDEGILDWWANAMYGGSVDKVFEQQIESAYQGALEQVKAFQKNKADIEQKAAEDSEAKYTEESQKRQVEISAKVYAQTEAMRLEALRSGMSERQKVEDEYARRIQETHQRIEETQNSADKYAFEQQIIYLQTLRDARLKEIDERAKKEAEAARQQADAIATAFNQAVGSAITQNQERIAQMFDSTALLQRFDGIASALEVLGRQRGIR